MIGEIICVGNELLIGDTLNTNTQYLSQQLANLGIDVQYQMVVGDDDATLTEAVSVASSRSDIVIFSGGLGPTYDDMTKETVCKVAGEALVIDEPSLEAIRSFFERLGRTMADSNEKQALRPTNGKSLPNANGTAPGIYLYKAGTHYILLPGPPNELKPMFQEEVVPILREFSTSVITSKIYSLVGIGESDLVGKIGHLMNESVNPRIAPYAKLGSVNIRLTAKTSTAHEGQELIDQTSAALSPFIDEYCYSTEGESLEKVVIDLLRKKHMTLSMAESCTGGLLSSRIVSIPGASDVYLNGFTTYSNQAKEKWLGVARDILLEYGAVSEAVAIEMSEGVKNVSATNVGIGVTGIAGPDGGTEDKPVGMVCISVSVEDETKVRTYHITGNRQKVREYGAQYALRQLYEMIK